MIIYRSLKRLFDIVVSGIGILILSPLLITVILILLLTGEHDVFYGQKRIGKKRKYFKIWKFVTMRRNSEVQAGGMHTMRGDPRVLPFGRFLRKTKINEIPQIFNIFLGDMTIVGPRPQVDSTFEPYTEEVKRKICLVPPGLTGIGSIVFRDEEAILSRVRAEGGNVEECYAKVIAPYKGALELWYLKHYNLWTDLKLIAITAWVVIRPGSRHILKIIFKDLPEKSPELKVYSPW